MRSVSIVLMGIVMLPALAGAQCTTKTDANAVRKSVKLAASCNYKKLLKGPAITCKTSPAPACSGTLVGDAIALAWGANNPPAAAVDRSVLRDQISCQKQISKGVVDFVAKKLKYLVQGLSPADAALKARRSIDKIPSKCLVIVTKDASGVVLPDVGPQLDAAVPPIPPLPAQPVDTTTLPDALVTLLETWVDRVGPNPQPLRPNIVLILSDDQRFDTIDLTHSKDGVTPVMPTVLSEIVGKGVSFNNSFVTTALCAPSRSSLLTGKYSHTTGVHDNGGSDGGFQAFNDASTVAVWMKAAGYHTGLYGKYINGYNKARAVHPARLGRVARVQERRLLQLHAGEQRERGGVRQRRRRLLHRRAARPRRPVHPRLGGAAALLPLLRAEGAACPGDPGSAACGQLLGHPALAAAELQRGGRLRQTGLVAGDRPVGRHEASERRTPSIRSSSSPCRRSTRPSRRCSRPCRTSGSWITPSSSMRRTTATRGARIAGSRSSARTRSACACRSPSATSRWRRCRASRPGSDSTSTTPRRLPSWAARRPIPASRA